MFSAQELQAFKTDTRVQLEAQGVVGEKIEKLARKEYLSWLNELKQELKAQITSNATLDPAQSQRRRQKAHQSFKYFTETYFPHYLSIKGTCALHQDFIVTFESFKGQGVYCAKAAPRAHGKTVYSRLGLLWLMVTARKKFLVVISDAVELAEGIVEALKAELEDNANLALDFPKSCGTGSLWRVGDIVSQNGVRLKAFGSGKRLRGVNHGAFRSDMVVLDDLENDTNVRSKTQRDKLEAWVDEAVLNLGSADRSMDVLYVGTVLHQDSVLARKLKLGFWHPQKFASIIQFPKRMDLWDAYGHIYKSQGEKAAHIFYQNQKTLMDEDAQVLWPAALPLEKLMQIRAQNPTAFNKEQMNNPLHENQLFKKENITFYTDAPRCDAYYMWLDPAGAGKKSDFAAIVVLGVNKQERKAYVCECVVKVMEGRVMIKTVLQLQSRYRCKVVGVETNGGQFHLKNWLLEKAFDKGVHLPLKGIHNARPKNERIEELELPLVNGEILLHPTQTLLIEQLQEFPEAAHDDAPDALHGAYTLKMARLRKKKTKRAHPYGCHRKGGLHGLFE